MWNYWARGASPKCLGKALRQRAPYWQNTFCEVAVSFCKNSARVQVQAVSPGSAQLLRRSSVKTNDRGCIGWARPQGFTDTAKTSTRELKVMFVFAHSRAAVQNGLLADLHGYGARPSADTEYNWHFNCSHNP